MQGEKKEEDREKQGHEAMRNESDLCIIEKLCDDTRGEAFLHIVRDVNWIELIGEEAVAQVHSLFFTT